MGPYISLIFSLRSFYKHNEPVINAAIFGPLKAEEHFLGQAIVVYFWAFEILHQSLLSKNYSLSHRIFKVLSVCLSFNLHF